MEIEARIVAVLAPLFPPGRVFADTVEGNVEPPYAIFQQVGGQALSYLEDVRPDLQNGRFQVAVWANTRAAASTLGRRCAKALVESDLHGEELGALVATADPVTRRRGTRQDFSIWWNEPP